MLNFLHEARSGSFKYRIDSAPELAARLDLRQSAASFTPLIFDGLEFEQEPGKSVAVNNRSSHNDRLTISFH
jgi:hypothetical protein